MNEYELKTKAIDDLVDASEDNTQEYSQEELSRFRSRSGIRIPSAVKAILAKLWFNGVVCYFCIWGLGFYIGSQLDLYVVTSLIMGFWTDIIVNNVLRFLAKESGGNDGWMMFPRKGYASLVFDVVYAFVLMALVSGFYNALNGALMGGSLDGSVPFAVEPVTFGLIYLCFDMAFILLKRLMLRIVADARGKVDSMKRT